MRMISRITLVSDRRIAMNNVAPCDVKPGIDPEKFASRRLANRCGDPTQLRTMEQFGRYAADMMFYVIEGESARAPKPVAQC